MHEMTMQQTYYPQLATPADLGDRAQLILTAVFTRYASWSASGLPLDASLTALALGPALARAWREAASGRLPGPLTLWLCWIIAVYSGTIVGMGLDWPQYYVPLVMVNVLLQGQTVGVAADWLGTLAQRFALHRAEPMAET
jgi:hypothetical protein